MTNARQTRRTTYHARVEGNVPKALAATGNVRRSAEAAKVSRAFVYEQRVDDPSSPQRWDAALDQAAPVLEEEIVAARS